MTTERELLKEAAKIMKSVKQVAGDVRFVNEIKNDLTVSIENIEAHLSQPDAVAMTWEEAKDKAAHNNGYEDWQDVEDISARHDYWDKALVLIQEAAHLFMESNRVQRWIPVEERFPDVFDVLILVMQDAPDGKQYPVIKWAAYLKEENEFHTDYAQEWPTHWQPLPEVPGVYLEGNK